MVHSNGGPLVHNFRLWPSFSTFPGSWLVHSTRVDNHPNLGLWRFLPFSEASGPLDRWTTNLTDLISALYPEELTDFPSQVKICVKIGCPIAYLRLVKLTRKGRALACQASFKCEKLAPINPRRSDIRISANDLIHRLISRFKRSTISRPQVGMINLRLQS